MMILSMILSSLSVLFGYYAEIGGLMIAIYSAIGIYIHQNFAKMALSMTLRDKVSHKDTETFQSLSTLAAVGHGSAEMKNIVICALGLFLWLQGSGPFSLTEKLWH